MFVPLLFAASLLTAAASISLNPTSPTVAVDRSLLDAPDSGFGPAAPWSKDSVLYGELTEGVLYSRIRTRSGAMLHALAIDTKSGVVVEAAKAGGAYDGLETLGGLYERVGRDMRRNGDTLLAAINAGPWHPQRHSPVGPLVVGGDVVELASDDAWSSLLLYAAGGAAITRDRVTGQILWRHRRLDVRSVNRRTVDDGAVVYTRMYGDAVPRAATKSDAEIVADALSNAESVDTGIDFEEEEVDTAEILRAYRFSRSREDAERRALKIAVRRLPTARRDWLGEARINDTMWTLITAVDTGIVSIPSDGYVLSAGAGDDVFRSARVGDTVRLYFQIARNGIGSIHDVVPGYPQLLFEGAVSSEPDFAQGPAAAVRSGLAAARSAVGISADGNTIHLVAVEAPHPSGGMTIDELAEAMRALGAHDAVALEGRASTTMIVNDEAVTHPAGAPPQRRISNALVVRKKRRW